MKVYHDGGGGITDISKEHFAKHAKQIEPLEVNISRNGPFSFQLYGIDKVSRNAVAILESGFNCGYGGDGPHGSAWALEQLGCDHVLATTVFARKSVFINFRGTTPQLDE